MATKSDCNQDPPVTPTLLALGEALGSNGKRLDLFETGDLSIELRTGSDALWAVIRRAGKGGLAIRAATIAGDARTDRLTAEPGETARIKAVSALGAHSVILQGRTIALTSIRILTSFTPSAATALSFVPRDLYPLGPGDDPTGAAVVGAGQ